MDRQKRHTLKEYIEESIGTERLEQKNKVKIKIETAKRLKVAKRDIREETGKKTKGG